MISLRWKVRSPSSALARSSRCSEGDDPPLSPIRTIRFSIRVSRLSVGGSSRLRFMVFEWHVSGPGKNFVLDGWDERADPQRFPNTPTDRTLSRIKLGNDERSRRTLTTLWCQPCCGDSRRRCASPSLCAGGYERSAAGRAPVTQQSRRQLCHLHAGDHPGVS